MDNPELAKISIPYDQFHVYSVIAWIECNNFDPFCLIRTDYPGVVLPPSEMRKPQVTLNLASRSLGKCSYGDHALTAEMRFNGTPFRVTIPYRAFILFNFRGTGNVVPAMWARPDGTGGFTVDLPKQDATPAAPVAQTEVNDPAPMQAAIEPETPTPPPRRVGHLSVVK